MFFKGSQEIRQRMDYGEFFKVKHLRVRLESIISYGENKHKDAGGEQAILHLNYVGSHPNHGILCENMEEAKKLAQQLDWQFKRQKEFVE